MNTKIVIVADLGLLRAYREVQRLTDLKPHLELIDEIKPEAAHEKMSDQVTDQAGRFPRGGGAAGMSGDLSAGERLHQGTEQSRRLIDLLAKRIDGLLADPAITRCALAVSAPIHKQLLEALNPNARAKVVQCLASNLAKTPPGELLSHFAKAGT